MEEKKESKKESLSIKLAGHDYVTVWPNEQKTEAKHPDYKGNGAAVWIHKEKISPEDVATGTLHSD